jgi:hypothetical protein
VVLRWCLGGALRDLANLVSRDEASAWKARSQIRRSIAFATTQRAGAITGAAGKGASQWE